MGHSDAKTTEIYSHYAPDPTRGGELIERAFRGSESGWREQPLEGIEGCSGAE